MHALVIAGGDAPAPIDATLAAAPLVIAADSGVGHALALGLAVDLVIGDLDSAVPDDVARAASSGARVDHFPADKDATDLELALDAARARGATSVTVLGIGGGRLDHLLANLLLLTHDAYAGLTVDALDGATWVRVVRTSRTLPGPIGSTVTLLPIGGPARGVRTTGLRWTLTDAALVPASTLGVSNEIVESPATVSVREGVLLAIQPTAGAA
jgi:thiamine pyrophosphokinase